MRHPQGRTKAEVIKATEHGTADLSNTMNSGREARCSYMLDLLNSAPYQRVQDIATDNKRFRGDMWEVDLKRSLEQFDNRGNPIQDQTSGSIEDLHNKYHGLIGWAGVMGNPTVAAFDPVFYIHHW